ncbi:aldehyde dehydrogenase [Sinomonas cyclohexanicum]|uniref:Aldehyde dehydrogenase n=1 Tax=Sinomonas cyclohexanicum TaxID=322009 RepID=A0ABM7PYP8_SINCY|nr:aldehyde dehydrogenase [Corynebacterium cyclohexanicum]
MLDAVVRAAVRAAAPAAAASDGERAAWLEAVAEALDAARDELVAIAERESHLPAARLTGEVARTTGQLRLFASVVRDGAYLEAIIDRARPDAMPPQPDLRRILRPLGPVAVFSASNFPFAFSVAGGDTASALAVGCPVVVKGHSGHPELSVRTARIVAGALAGAGAPDGVFGLVLGRTAGNALVQAPGITAVGFTGSLSGGRALFDLASARPDPIPFYGELGSINPVVVTPAAAEARTAELAAGLAASFTLGVGQFCTKPGLVLVPAGAGFEPALAAEAAAHAGGPMLTARIADAFPAGLRRLVAEGGATAVIGDPGQDTSGGGARPVVLAVDAARVLARPDVLLEECFGPMTLVVRYGSEAERDAVLDAVGGSLTATLHAEPDEDVAALAARLAERAGRVLFGGWPTGVAVTWSQHHGGPWPATTSALHTSVGATAVRRFQRPVVFQDAPASVLPAALRDGNPRGIPRRIDGSLTRGAV